MLAACAAALLLADGAGAQSRRPAPRACSAEIGAAAARALASDCRESRPMTPALCRPETPCDALREMIAEACRTPGAETRPACRDQEDDEEDDDDEGE